MCHSVSNIQLKITTQARKQENVTHNQQEKKKKNITMDHPNAGKSRKGLSTINMFNSRER